MSDAAVADAEITATDAETVAEEAGLVYVSDAEPGVRRRRRGDRFSYRGVDGKPVSKATRARIEALAIPPAWSDVWICPLRNGHLQATGRDARGRKQYRYHDTWREVRDADKFSRLGDFGGALDGLRGQIEADLRSSADDRDRVLALVVRLLDETLIRVGNDEYATTNDSFGLTTLRPDHVEVEGSEFTLCFVGKSGVEHDVTVHDRRLARLVKRCHELGGQELFTYRAADGSIARVTSADVNDYLHHHVGPDVTAKVFRTWGATAVVARSLAEAKPVEDEAQADEAVIAAIDRAADLLRNTRAVCRQSYVHPLVLDAYRDDTLADTWSHTRGGARLDRADRTVLRLLTE
ncbi:MAG: DNA topoisomerase IB [Acidimicrobiales bacterium]